jgi:HPt (histidine-containing phosphotransfer) domain-containing protein
MADTVNGWSLPEDLPQLAFGSDQTEMADITSRLQELRQAMMEGDLTAIVQHARGLKACAVRRKAAGLAATCRHLELDAAHQVTENLERLLHEAEAEVTSLCGSSLKANLLTNAAGAD